MATATNGLRAFHEFVGRELAEGGAEPPSTQDCLDLWLVDHPSPEDEFETLDAIREGRADLPAGRTRPAEDVLRDLCRKQDVPTPR